MCCRFVAGIVSCKVAVSCVLAVVSLQVGEIWCVVGIMKDVVYLSLSLDASRVGRREILLCIMLNSENGLALWASSGVLCQSQTW